MEEAPKTYRLTVRTTEENKQYLQEMAWRRRIDLTQYVNELIEADKAAHPEWKETIDVLNT